MQFAKILCERRNCIHDVHFISYVLTTEMGKRCDTACVSCRLFLSPASRVSNQPRLVITVVVIGPETAVALVQLRCPCNLPANGVKTGGFPAAHKALTPRALYSRLSPQKRRLSSELAWRTSGSSGARHCASRYLPDSTDAGGLSMRSSCNAPFAGGRRRRFFSIGGNGVRFRFKKKLRWEQFIYNVGLFLSQFFFLLLPNDDFTA